MNKDNYSFLEYIWTVYVRRLARFKSVYLNLSMLISTTSSLENVKEHFPAITYKYRDWNDSKHKTIITKQQVYFAPPSIFWKFGDPFDCRFPVEFDFSYEANRPALEGGYPYDKSSMTRRDLEFELKRQHRVNTETEAAQKQFIQNYYDLSNHHLGILSITGRNDNLKIWESNYAVDFNGFCVGIDFRECLNELAKAGIGGGTVSYVASDTAPLKYVSTYNRNSDEVIAHHIELTHTKYKQYTFEEEYRLTKRFFSNKLWSNIPNEDRLFTVPKECFKTVTFGYKMPEASRQEIVQACTEQGLVVDFNVASPSEDGLVLIKT